jgi:hypothetical protein
LVWFGLVWFGLVWFGLVWFGLVWFGLVELNWVGLGFKRHQGGRLSIYRDTTSFYEYVLS